MERVKITAKGQITLPKRLRDRLKLKDGDYLGAYLRGNELVFRPLTPNSGTQMLVEYCKNNSKAGVSVKEAQEILERVPFSLSERVGKLREETQND